MDPDRNPDPIPLTDVLVVRVEAGLSFANADHVRISALIDENTTRVVLNA